MKTISPEKLKNKLVAGSLRGPGQVAVMPLVRARKDEKESWILIHLGERLCGHEGIIHGGMIATVFDEWLASTVSVHFTWIPLTTLMH